MAYARTYALVPPLVFIVLVVTRDHGLCHAGAGHGKGGDGPNEERDRRGIRDVLARPCDSACQFEARRAIDALRMGRP